jgi:hypothetical protein
MEVMNGVQKPADVIARGPHVYVESERKYKEASPVVSPWPRAMWHEDGGYTEARSLPHQKELEGKGWKTQPFPPKPVAAAAMPQSADLAMIVLQQQQVLEQQARQIAQLMEGIKAPVATPESAKHSKVKE